MTDNELKEKFAELAVAQAKTEREIDKFIAEMEASNAEVKLQMQETDRKILMNEEKLSKLRGDQSAMSSNIGSTTEEYFYNSMLDNLKLGGIQFDEIGRNVQRRSKRLEDEYDIVLYNGDCVALIECKFKAHENDIRGLIDRKVDNFRTLFPYYKDYKIYLGLASFSFYPELEEFANQNGVAILKQKGDVVEIQADNLRAY